MTIQIMDTTLRDGEQTSGISFTVDEKLSMAKLLLEEVKVDRIEIASARVSEGEYEAVKKIVQWATRHCYINQVEVLGFVDGGVSIDWIANAGCKAMNLLTKGSLKHVSEQLRKTPEQHLADIKESIRYATSKGITVNIYLEDWSNGMRHSPEYVFFMLEGLKDAAINRYMLPDTLGILNPTETFDFCKQVVDRFPGLNFDFHAHNDYDFSVANVYSALRAGVTGIHTTVNGLGERAGNVPMASVIAMMKDHLGLETNVVESILYPISKLVERFSYIRIPPNKPIVGDNVFTQTSGVHADGDNKNKLYYNDLMPERFGRVRSYALGKTSGKANIKKNLEEIGIELDAESMKKVTQRIIELGDKKEVVTREDLPYIISDVLKEKSIAHRIEISNYSLSSATGLRPVASLLLRIDTKTYEESASGDGQYDAFMQALRKIYSKLNKELPPLTDYIVTIPPGGRTDALVETIVTWQWNGKELKTRAVDSDQTVAAIKATEKMLNIIEK